MNTDDKTTELPDALRWQLRGLRRDAEPRRELWDGIAARIATQPQMAPTTPPAPRRRARPFALLATAAVLAMAVGIGWQLRPDAAPAPASLPVREAHAPLLAIQAEAMAREYEGALRVVQAAYDAPVASPVLAELDASAAALRAAIAQAPDSRFLFDRLQRVYAQRLALTQRLVQA